MYATMPLTPDSITIVLAYLHYYTPNFLPGRCLSVTHLRSLAAWMQMAVPGLRSIRTNPRMAAHLTLGHAAGLLTVGEGFWRTTSETLSWLEMKSEAQTTHLRQALTNRAAWETALSALSLNDVVTIDYLTYVEQQLMRCQPDLGSMEMTAVWLPDTEEEVWQLDMPSRLRPHLQFHMLQMGEWLPAKIWRGTPYSIARAAQQGYSLTLMEATLLRVTGQAFSAERRNQLVDWYQRHDAYQIRPVYLLSVKDPAHLNEVMRQQRWRAHIGQRLCQRHAIVSPQLIPLLERRLQETGFVLDAPALAREPGEKVQNIADSWLALEVLAGLGKLIPLPFSLPSETRIRLAEQLTLEQQAALGQKAEQVLEGVQAALRGRDAFFVREQPVDPELITIIRTALAEEQELEISYQSLGEMAPRWRQVEPHWLEEQEWGLYLHGFCYLAESNRVFRLDRIKAWRTAEEWATG